MKKRLSVGRSAANEVVVDDPTVSRKHAELVLIGSGMYRLLDNDSANGTFVKIADAFHRVAEAEVEIGDTVRFGDYEATVSALIDRAERPSARRRRRLSGRDSRGEPARALNPIAEVRPTERVQGPVGNARAAPGTAPPPPAAARPRRIGELKILVVALVAIVVSVAAVALALAFG